MWLLLLFMKTFLQFPFRTQQPRSEERQGFERPGKEICRKGWRKKPLVEVTAYKEHIVEICRSIPAQYSIFCGYVVGWEYKSKVRGLHNEKEII